MGKRPLYQGVPGWCSRRGRGLVRGRRATARSWGDEARFRRSARRLLLHSQFTNRATPSASTFKYNMRFLSIVQHIALTTGSSIFCDEQSAQREELRHLDRSSNSLLKCTLIKVRS
jgi:hypothetical protein